MSVIDPDEDLVRALLRDQHPDLAERELTAVQGGWDNRMWRLGDDLAVRMPRTERAPSLLRSEQRWLPLLAPTCRFRLRCRFGSENRHAGFR